MNNSSKRIKLWTQSTLIPSQPPDGTSTGPLGLGKGKPLPKHDSKKSFAREHFTEEGKCRHCLPPKEATLSMKNVTRLKEHLLNIKVCPFLLSAAAQNHDDREVREAVAALRKQEGKLRSMAADSGAGSTATGAPCVSTFLLDRMTTQEHKELQEEFAKMMYLTGLPLSWVEHEAVQVMMKIVRMLPCSTANLSVPQSMMPSVHDAIRPRH
jgi:hypothetical protein